MSLRMKTYYVANYGLYPDKSLPIAYIWPPKLRYIIQATTNIGYEVYPQLRVFIYFLEKP